MSAKKKVEKKPTRKAGFVKDRNMIIPVEAKKHDDLKLRYDLIPTGPLAMVAKVYTEGAKKYDDNNWRKGMRWGRVYAAIQRHLNAFWAGENDDHEWGINHLAHAAWGCLTLIYYSMNGIGTDDRVNDMKIINNAKEEK